MKKIDIIAAILGGLLAAASVIIGAWSMVLAIEQAVR